MGKGFAFPADKIPAGNSHEVPHTAIFRVDDIGQPVDAVRLVLYPYAEVLSIQWVVGEIKGMVEPAFQLQDLVKGAIGLPLRCGLKKGQLSSPILHHVNELDSFCWIDFSLPAQPDIRVDVVGVVRHIQLVDGSRINPDFDDLSRGGRLFLWPKRSFLDEFGLRISGE